MITIEVVPAEEYPSKPVPPGWRLVRIDGLDNCAMIIGCTQGDEEKIDALRWGRELRPRKFNANATECLVIHLPPNEYPSPEAGQAIIHHITDHVGESFWVAVQPGYYWFSAIPYREEQS